MNVQIVDGIRSRVAFNKQTTILELNLGIGSRGTQHSLKAGIVSLGLIKFGGNIGVGNNNAVGIGFVDSSDDQLSAAEISGGIEVVLNGNELSTRGMRDGVIGPERTTGPSSVSSNYQSVGDVSIVSRSSSIDGFTDGESSEVDVVSYGQSSFDLSGSRVEGVEGNYVVVLPSGIVEEGLRTKTNERDSSAVGRTSRAFVVDSGIAESDFLSTRLGCGGKYISWARRGSSRAYFHFIAFANSRAANGTDGSELAVVTANASIALFSLQEDIHKRRVNI